jgi:predicted enzyme related to lactoylglutathione lyase
MKIECLSALVRYSPDAERLARFYRDCLGIPLAPARHGDLGLHFEAYFRRTHYAIWQKEGSEADRLVPTYLVRRLTDCFAELEARGLSPLDAVRDIGEGKRIATFLDPDGSRFRLIEIAPGSRVR